MLELLLRYLKYSTFKPKGLTIKYASIKTSKLCSWNMT